MKDYKISVRIYAYEQIFYLTLTWHADGLETASVCKLWVAEAVIPS